ncbi:hypothetical protein M422DRAFT_166783, partial [Sphaerobolus stellatus SS14]
GSTQCCTTTAASDSTLANTLAGLLGIVLSGVIGDIGLGCTPITLFSGVGQGANCAQQPVCCTGNQFNGLINVGCTPISL